MPPEFPASVSSVNQPVSPPSWVRYGWIVIVVSLVCLFGSLGASRFWDQDEGYFASTAAEMYAKGEWVVPTFNGELFGHKPPWMYWMMMAGYGLFGVGEFGARFFAAIFGLATAFLTFRLGAILFRPRVGLIAGLVLPSCLMFSVVARAATPDVYLAFFSTLALYLFAQGGLIANPQTGNATLGSVPKKRSTWIWIYAMMGLAALVKGPIGFLFPMAVIGLYLLLVMPSAQTTEDRRAGHLLALGKKFSPTRFWGVLMRMRLATALVMICPGREFFQLHKSRSFALGRSDVTSSSRPSTAPTCTGLAGQNQRQKARRAGSTL